MWRKRYFTHNNEGLIIFRINKKQVVESDFVLCTSVGTPFGPRNVVRHFKKALKKTDLPQSIRVHDLRHTFVSYMLAQNVPSKDVQVIAAMLHYRQQCGVPVTAQCLRHSFASQMLTAGMPVSSLQRYLGHEHLDTPWFMLKFQIPC